MSAQSAEAVGQGVSQGLFAASSAANAIPIAGQFVSAGLAIAGLFTKLFAGKKQRKKEEAARAAKAKQAGIEQMGGNTPSAPATSSGQQAQQSIIPVTTNYNLPQTPSFQGGGGAEPTISPTQQALNNRIL